MINWPVPACIVDGMGIRLSWGWVWAPARAARSTSVSRVRRFRVTKYRMIVREECIRFRLRSGLRIEQLLGKLCGRKPETGSVPATEFAHDRADELLGVAEEHQRAVEIVERVVDTGEAGAHAAF